MILMLSSNKVTSTPLLAGTGEPKLKRQKIVPTEGEEEEEEDPEGEEEEAYVRTG